MPQTKNIPTYVEKFIKDAKEGKEYVGKNGIPEKLNESVYKVMYYAINENIVDCQTRDWIIWNLDQFALLWLFYKGGIDE